LDNQGTISRKIDSYRVGVLESYEDLDTPPVDPREIAGSEGNVTSINRYQFDDMWEQSREMPDGFMGLFF